jgi:hypothetical protein
LARGREFFIRSSQRQMANSHCGVIHSSGSLTELPHGVRPQRVLPSQSAASRAQCPCRIGICESRFATQPNQPALSMALSLDRRATPCKMTNPDPSSCRCIRKLAPFSTFLPQKMDPAGRRCRRRRGARYSPDSANLPTGANASPAGGHVFSRRRLGAGESRHPRHALPTAGEGIRLRRYKRRLPARARAPISQRPR